MYFYFFFIFLHKTFVLRTKIKVYIISKQSYPNQSLLYECANCDFGNTLMLISIKDMCFYDIKKRALFQQEYIRKRTDL